MTVPGTGLLLSLPELWDLDSRGSKLLFFHNILLSSAEDGGEGKAYAIFF